MPRRWSGGHGLRGGLAVRNHLKTRGEDCQLTSDGGSFPRELIPSGGGKSAREGGGQTGPTSARGGTGDTHTHRYTHMQTLTHACLHSSPPQQPCQHIPWGSVQMTFWKRQNYGDREETRGHGGWGTGGNWADGAPRSRLYDHMRLSKLRTAHQVHLLHVLHASIFLSYKNINLTWPRALLFSQRMSRPSIPQGLAPGEAGSLPSIPSTLLSE